MNGIAVSAAIRGEISLFQLNTDTKRYVPSVVTVILITYVIGNCKNFFNVGFCLYVNKLFIKNEPIILIMNARIWDIK